MCFSPGHGGKMFLCPKCGYKNPLMARACMKCKYVFKEEERPQKNPDNK